MAIVKIDSGDSPKSGSPQDRGAADAYYGRPMKPHMYLGGDQTQRIEEAKMTPQEIAEYKYGYNNQDDFKEW